MGQKLVNRLTDAAALLAGGIMVSMLILILLEIVMRNFLHTSTFVAHELVGYGLAALVFLGLAHAFRSRGLVRMSLIISRLEPRRRRFVEILSVLLTLGLSAYLSNFFLISIQRNFSRGSVSGSIAEIPLWLVELPVIIGLAVFMLQMGLYLIQLLTLERPGFDETGGSGS